MSFTTRCPACGTVFRVVADQLKISDGWVRCGHCSDVFDATIHLQAWVPPARGASPTSRPAGAGAPGPVEPPAMVPARVDEPTAPEPAPIPDAASVPQPAVLSSPVDSEASTSSMLSSATPLTPGATDVPDDDDLHAWFGEGPLDAPTAATPSAVAPVPGPVDQAIESPPAVDRTTALAVEAAEVAEEAEQVDPAGQALAPEFQAELERFAQSARSFTPVATLPASAREDQSSVPASEQIAHDTGAEDDEPADAAEPGFMRQARRRALWSSSGVRAALGVAALLLTALLVAQWTIQQRRALVATHPPLRPWLEQACTWLGCDLNPVRRIDAVEIESAELVRRLGNFYSFDFVLRNRSTFEVAMPALELTLTGLGEQTVARRVFLPQDWPDAPSVLPAGGSVSVSLRLALMLGDDAPTAGYRALAFYP